MFADNSGLASWLGLSPIVLNGVVALCHKTSDNIARSAGIDFVLSALNCDSEKLHGLLEKTVGGMAAIRNAACSLLGPSSKFLVLL